MKKPVVFLALVMIFILPAVVSAATPRNQTGFNPELDVDVWVDGLASYALSTKLDTGDTIYVEVEVTSGAGIDFFICDQANYDIFRALGSPYVFQQQQSVGSVSTSFSVPSSGTWFCVFFNDALLTSKHLEGYIGTVPPNPIGGDLLLLLVVPIAAVVIGGAIWFGSKKKPKPPSVLQKSYSAPKVDTNYCPYCGKIRQSLDACFCANCGQSFAGPDLR